MKIRDQDRRAIDLLLDRTASATAPASNAPAYAATDGQLRQSVACIEKVLSLLELMPAQEPPRLLLNRTLSHIKQESGRDVTIPKNFTDVFGSHRPVA
ncbi:MAG TPA: hypothetical protein VG326_09600 [Tepidisphaeraceae bacterium]|nr:hypothetical protein [Tepidisphaeraceae bacterium]